MFNDLSKKRNNSATETEIESSKKIKFKNNTDNSSREIKSNLVDQFDNFIFNSEKNINAEKEKYKSAMAKILQEDSAKDNWFLS